MHKCEFEVAYLSERYGQMCAQTPSPTTTKEEWISSVDGRPSSQIPSLAYSHESSPSKAVSVDRTSSRGPQTEHCAQNAKRVDVSGHVLIGQVCVSFMS